MKIIFSTTLALMASKAAEGFASPSRPTFVSDTSVKAVGDMRMDVETPFMQMEIGNSLQQARQSLDLRLLETVGPSTEEAEAALGMPWKSSIGESTEEDALLYMPFWEWQMSFMKENLTDLRVLPCTDRSGKQNFELNENGEKKARIVNMCFTSKEYRKIRLTYYDAGDNTQVFNSVWYPNPAYNLPVLGVDLLAFNRKKYLAIVDFQPLHENEEDHAATYEDILKPIKESYKSLQGRMSAKFYDETKFFSQQMLFARFEDKDVINNDLFPAFQQYVGTHLSMLKETEPCMAGRQFVLERQTAYDTYSAERDPATGLFAAMFGQDWANDFVYDFLFSRSERPDGEDSLTCPPMGVLGGPPPQARSQAKAPPVETSRRSP